jgi:hypothetical protein
MHTNPSCATTAATTWPSALQPDRRLFGVCPPPSAHWGGCTAPCMQWGGAWHGVRAQRHRLSSAGRRAVRVVALCTQPRGSHRLERASRVQMEKIRTLPAEMAVEGIPANVDASWDGGTYDVAEMRQLLAARCACRRHACPSLHAACRMMHDAQN